MCFFKMHKESVEFCKDNCWKSRRCSNINLKKSMLISAQKTSKFLGKKTLGEKCKQNWKYLLWRLLKTNSFSESVLHIKTLNDLAIFE